MLRSAPPLVSVVVASLLAVADVRAAPVHTAAVKPAKVEAPDTAPPTIHHTPVTSMNAGDVVIEADIEDPSGVFEPTLLVRRKGGGAFVRVPMKPSLTILHRFSAVVPRDMTSSDVEYFVEAFDNEGNGPAHVGDENAPLVIAHGGTGTSTGTGTGTSTTPPTTPPNDNHNLDPHPPDDHGIGTSITPPPKKAGDDDGLSPLVWGVSIAGGVVVAAALATGVVFLAYELRAPAPTVVHVSVSGPSPIATVTP